jgi:hypothetical protein
MPQASRHSEVDQESATGLEPNNQILASTLECAHALTFELPGDGVGLEGPDESWIANLDALQPTTDEVRLERATNRLDLGQLRHQLSVSSTIGRELGGSRAMS